MKIFLQIYIFYLNKFQSRHKDIKLVWTARDKESERERENNLVSLMTLLYSFLLFLLFPVFGNSTSGSQRNVDVQDCHDDDWKIECCYSGPKCHCRVRKELNKKRDIDQLGTSRQLFLQCTTDIFHF